MSGLGKYGLGEEFDTWIKTTTINTHDKRELMIAKATWLVAWNAGKRYAATATETPLAGPKS